MLGNSATLDLVVETAGLTDLTCAQMRKLFDGIRIAVYENVSKIGFAQVPGIVGALASYVLLSYCTRRPARGRSAQHPPKPEADFFLRDVQCVTKKRVRKRARAELLDSVLLSL